MKFRTASVIVLSALLLAAYGANADVDSPSTPGKQDLAIVLQGIKNDRGRLIVTVYDNPTDYAQYGNPIATASLPPVDNISVAFRSLPDGDYAVIAFHDADENGDLNMENDYPTEGYGGSGIESRFDEPDFDGAVVEADIVYLRMFYLE